MVTLVLTVRKLGLSGFPWAWQLLAAAFGFLISPAGRRCSAGGGGVGRITNRCVLGATGEVGELDMKELMLFP